MKLSTLSESTRISYFKSVGGTSLRVDGLKRTSLPSRRKTMVATAASSDGSPAVSISMHAQIRGLTRMLFRQDPRHCPYPRWRMDNSTEANLTKLNKSRG